MKKGRKSLKEKTKNILDNFEEAKRKHLEFIGTKLLKQDEINQKLKEKKITGSFLDLF